ncbi:hypothetical protein [Alteromonas macleodii]|uniref:hypothetical protein n=1 Tax=Alteromonas macleodii TaxID=28108 RepID=UPI00314096FE
MATGCFAPNPREGARSEFLAQYVLSAFGACQLVARTEDYGLDFFCTLGYKIGQRFFVRDYYNVQVKSNEKSFTYDDKESLKWALSLPTPIIFLTVDKTQHRLRFYAPIGLEALSVLIGTAMDPFHWRRNGPTPFVP